MKRLKSILLIVALASFSFLTSCKKENDAPNSQDNISVLECNKKMVSTAVHCIAGGFGSVFQSIITDTLERVDFCRVFIDTIRFFDDLSGYLFIYDFNGYNVAIGVQKELQGQNLYDYQDSHGKFLIRDMIEIVKNEGKGLIEYYWQNPYTLEEEKKLSYIEKIPGINYFIGSGIYEFSPKSP